MIGWSRTRDPGILGSSLATCLPLLLGFAHWVLLPNGKEQDPTTRTSPHARSIGSRGRPFTLQTKDLTPWIAR